ncbi:uncharacterized protein C10orf143 homolog isoform X1 [Callithrix jacchus]
MHKRLQESRPPCPKMWAQRRAGPETERPLALEGWLDPRQWPGGATVAALSSFGPAQRPRQLSACDLTVPSRQPRSKVLPGPPTEQPPDTTAARRGGWPERSAPSHRGARLSHRKRGGPEAHNSQKHPLSRSSVIVKAWRVPERMISSEPHGWSCERRRDKPASL